MIYIYACKYSAENYFMTILFPFIKVLDYSIYPPIMLHVSYNKYVVPKLKLMEGQMPFLHILNTMEFSNNLQMKTNMSHLM
jgi:hypothetical protein